MTSQQQFDTFAAYCRYNTGSHMLDSGSAYGRHHEQPPIKITDPAVTIEVSGRGSGKFDDREPEVLATISLAHWLHEKFEIVEDMMAEFAGFVDADETRDSWFEMGPRFMESKGFTRATRDNVYNNENDFSQVFVWEVWCPADFDGDWVYCEDAIVLIYIHTGCDVRGGYARPLIVAHSGDDYSMALDWNAGFHISDGTDAGGATLSPEDCQRLDEKWQPGYSSYPSGAFSKDIEHIVSFDESNAKITCILKTGETVDVVAHMPY